MTHRGVLKSPDVFTCKGYHILYKHHMLKHMVKRHTIVNLKSHCHELSCFLFFLFLILEGIGLVSHAWSCLMDFANGPI